MHVMCVYYARDRCQMQSVTPLKPQNLLTAFNALSPATPSTAWDRCVAARGKDTPQWTEQDLAVLGLIFDTCWEKALACEASSRPMKLKAAAMCKLLQKRWMACRVSLQAGLHTKKKSARYVFDGHSVLELVRKYRSNTKARDVFVGQVKFAVQKHYESMHWAYQPPDMNKPLHEHWAVIVAASRPKVSRAKLMRQAKKKASTAKLPTAGQQQQQPFGDLNVQENLSRALDYAVVAILK